MLRLTQRFFSLLLSSSLVLSANAFAQEKIPHLSFALIGDSPYSTLDEATLKNVLINISEDEDIAFIVHDGDLKGGNESCGDDLIKRRKAILESAKQPLIYIPGDNDWTDCHRPNNGSFDSVERLNRLRDVFFSNEFSLGVRKMKLTRQSESAKFRNYRENIRWTVDTDAGRILFVGLNIPGSNNNYLSDAGRNGEFEDRREATRQWLMRAGHIAKQEKMTGIVIIIQANPAFENKWQQAKPPSLLSGLLGTQRRDGYLELKRQLLDVAKDFTGKILFVHGDTHHFHVDKPLKDENGKVLENFTRIETYGYPFDSHWVKVTVDKTSPNLFVIESSLDP